MIRIGLIGGTGFAAGELCRLLLNHPEAEIVFAYSETYAERLLADCHEGLYGETDLCYTNELPFEEVDVVFVCLANDRSTDFLAAHYIPADVHIIDLGQDYRLKAEDNDFVYGLPELNRSLISNALHIACPGSLATCLLLGLLPLAEAGLLQSDVAAHILTGATATAEADSEAQVRFAWRTDNLSIYQPFIHPQIPETLQAIAQLQPGFQGELDLIPCRGNFARGIFASLLLSCESPIEEVEGCYYDFYSEASFTHYMNRPFDLKQVINTNKGLIYAERFRNKLLVTIGIDNLLKGAAGQAVQNMNLAFGLEETTGLRLKSTAF